MRMDSWGLVFISLMFGVGISLFFLMMLISAGLSGAWKLTIWTNTIGEGLPEIIMFLGVICLEFIGLFFHLRKEFGKKRTETK